MFSENERQIIVSSLAMSDTKQLENLLDRKDKLLVELQAVERTIQRKIKDLYYISNLK